MGSGWKSRRMSWCRSSRYNEGMNSRPVKIAIGLGSNVGDREANLRFGREELARHGVFWSAASEIYETMPVGPVQEQGLFLNQVAIGETELPPLALLGLCHAAERARGRERGERHVPQGPRTLDLDILMYGDTPIHEPGLTIPHPRLAERAFVLVPLAEVAGDWQVPATEGSSQTVAQLRDALANRDEEGVRPWRSSDTKPPM